MTEAQLAVLERELFAEMYVDWVTQPSYKPSGNWEYVSSTREGLMTRALEHALGTSHVAFLMSPEELARRHIRTETTGWRDVIADAVVGDPHALGFAYFDASHCMSMVVRDGRWFDVPQSAPKALDATSVRSRLCTGSGRLKGFVFVLSEPAARRHVWPMIYTAARRMVQPFSCLRDLAAHLHETRDHDMLALVLLGLRMVQRFGWFESMKEGIDIVPAFRMLVQHGDTMLARGCDSAIVLADVIMLIARRWMLPQAAQDATRVRVPPAGEMQGGTCTEVQAAEGAAAGGAETHPQ